MTELLALFGGTFDPVHYGHLRPLEELRQALGLRRIRLVPSAVPPHRESPGASPSERLHMLRLACEEYPAFEVDPRELRRRGPSYTVDTLTELSREHPRRCPCLVLGLDAFLGLPTWHRWRSVFALAGIAVMARPGWRRPDPLPGWWQGAEVADAASLRERGPGAVLLVPVTPVDISATALRRSIARGEPVSGRMPATVQAYIEQRGLYDSE